jgi:hypothetical protein
MDEENRTFAGLVWLRKMVLARIIAQAKKAQKHCALAEKSVINMI